MARSDCGGRAREATKGRESSIPPTDVWDVDMRDMLKQDGLNRQKHKYYRAAEQRMNGGKVDGDTRAAFLSRIIREADTQQPIQKQSTEWASGCS
jgi:hypothetical protein